MKNIALNILLLLFVFTSCGSSKKHENNQSDPTKQEVLTTLTKTNKYFMDKWPDTGKTIITNKERPSNIWTRAVYYEGLMDLYKLTGDKQYLNYAVSWGNSHNWGLAGRGVAGRHADYQACGQTYIELYNLDEQDSIRIRDIKKSIDLMMATDKIDDWDWIDALQMAMPIFEQLTVLTGDKSYAERAYQMYADTKNRQGLWNEDDDLWWRDADFLPPYKEPNGEDCYWARGNGWVVATYCRVLSINPNDSHAEEYKTMLIKMLNALTKIQREDGFWNVSLHDPTNYGGKEVSGTSLFIYGMAWAENHGLVEKGTYRKTIMKGWNAIANEAVHENGFIGYMQGTGKEPKDGQPVTYTSVPDFEDYGLGCVLMAGCEIYKML
ncbi:MAG: glycoside hydrolase family 88 protein [Mangrovibacterium sp.]